MEDKIFKRVFRKEGWDEPSECDKEIMKTFNKVRVYLDEDDTYVWLDRASNKVTIDLHGTPYEIKSLNGLELTINYRNGVLINLKLSKYNNPEVISLIRESLKNEN